MATDPRPGTFLTLERQLPSPPPLGASYEIPSAALALHWYRRARASTPWWRRVLGWTRGSGQ